MGFQVVPTYLVTTFPDDEDKSCEWEVPQPHLKEFLAVLNWNRVSDYRVKLSDGPKEQIARLRQVQRP